MTFFQTVLTILAHTPLWVWPLYAVLLFLGLQRSRDSIVPLWRFLILPIIVAILAVLGFVLSGQGTFPALLAGLAFGAPLGWWIEPEGSTHRLPTGALWLRGEWMTLGQIGLVVGFRYTTSVLAGLNPELHGNLTWRLGTIFVATALSAMFLGRTANRLRVFWRA